MPDQENLNYSANDIYLKLGELGGTMKTFIENQTKINDFMFDNGRKMASTLESHAEFIKNTEPLIPTLENLDTGKKVTKWGILAVMTLGGANLLIPMWSYIKTAIGVSPTIGHGP